MAERRSEQSRLEAFSDGVFALAATLLVVSLEVPATLGEMLAELSGIAAFALGFAALILIWSVHNAYFRRYGLQDGWTVALNGCLLFVVLYYVFPLKFVAAGFAGHVLGLGGGSPLRLVSSLDELGTLFLLYGLGFVLIFALFALMYRHAVRRSAMLALDARELWEARMLMRHYWIFAAVGVVSMLLAWSGAGLQYGVPGYAYALIGPLCWAHGAWSERRRPGATPAAA